MTDQSTPESDRVQNGGNKPKAAVLDPGSGTEPSQYKDDGKPAPDKGVPASDRNPAPTAHNRSNPRVRPSRREIFETVLSISTAVLALATVGLWFATRSAELDAAAANRHAEAAANAAHTAADAANTIARASLRVTALGLSPSIATTFNGPPDFNGSGSISVTFANTGTSDADGNVQIIFLSQRVTKQAIALTQNAASGEEVKPFSQHLHVAKGQTVTLSADLSPSSQDDVSLNAKYVLPFLHVAPIFLMVISYHFKDLLGTEEVVTDGHFWQLDNNLKVTRTTDVPDLASSNVIKIGLPELDAPAVRSSPFKH